MKEAINILAIRGMSNFINLAITPCMLMRLAFTLRIKSGR